MATHELRPRRDDDPDDTARIQEAAAAAQGDRDDTGDLETDGPDVAGTITAGTITTGYISGVELEVLDCTDADRPVTLFRHWPLRIDPGDVRVRLDERTFRLVEDL